MYCPGRVSMTDPFCLTFQMASRQISWLIHVPKFCLSLRILVKVSSVQSCLIFISKSLCQRITLFMYVDSNLSVSSQACSLVRWHWIRDVHYPGWRMRRAVQGWIHHASCPDIWRLLWRHWYDLANAQNGYCQDSIIRQSVCPDKVNLQSQSSTVEWCMSVLQGGLGACVGTVSRTPYNADPENKKEKRFHEAQECILYKVLKSERGLLSMCFWALCLPGPVKAEPQQATMDLGLLFSPFRLKMQTTQRMRRFPFSISTRTSCCQTLADAIESEDGWSIGTACETITSDTEKAAIGIWKDRDTGGANALQL